MDKGYFCILMGMFTLDHGRMIFSTDKVFIFLLLGRFMMGYFKNQEKTVEGHTTTKMQLHFTLDLGKMTSRKAQEY